MTVRNNLPAATGLFFAWLLSCAIHQTTAAAADPAQTAGGRKPNVLIIVADDLGNADLGCQGVRDIPTPNIDSLAKAGIRCTNGYVSCPVCSPTRAGLLTGRYQQRFGHEFNHGATAATNPQMGLPLTEVTLADRMSEAGYVTGMVGKWHLGLHESFHPTRRGFQEFFGFLQGQHSYVDSPPEPVNSIQRGTQPLIEKEYLTDAFSREAVEFIERHQKQQFFLYLTYNAVHMPLQAPEKYLSRFGHIQDEKRRSYAAMLSAMDDGVGKVLDKLRASGLEEDTLIFFISDNGGPTEVTTANNGQLKGYKSTIFEGGIRVPFIVQWKRRLPQNKLYEQPVISLDIFSTAIAAAGGTVPQSKVIDGVNLMPFLLGERQEPPHESLYWRYGHPRAIRQGRWKLVSFKHAPFQLYDLEADIGETVNLAAKEPAVTQRLADALHKWDAELAQPLWPIPSHRRTLPIDLTNPRVTDVYRPILIAHRGGVVTPQSPECSLAAIRLAALAGYQLVELDIRRTRDNYPVVFHDGELAKATAEKGSIENLDLEQVVAIRYRNVDEKISTLDAAMTLCKSMGLGVMLDVKDAESELMLQRVAECVRSHGMQRSTITLNGNPKIAVPLSSVSLVNLNARAQAIPPGTRSAERPLAGYFWFGLPKDLSESSMAQLQRDGALVIPAINTFRYPADMHQELAATDIKRLRELGVDGFQIDSAYQHRFGMPAP